MKQRRDASAAPAASSSTSSTEDTRRGAGGGRASALAGHVRVELPAEGPRLLAGVAGRVGVAVCGTGIRDVVEGLGLPEPVTDAG